MAYEMIIGRPPFEAETPLAIVLKHITEPLTPPISINPRVPQAVSDVISKALSKDPSDRYPTTAAFAQALSAVIAAGPVGGTLPLPSAAPTEASARHQTRACQGAAPLPPDWNHRGAARAVDDRHWRLADAFQKSASTRSACRDDRVGCECDRSDAHAGATPVSTSAITETSTVNADRCTPPLFAETFDDPDSGLPHGEQDDSRWGYADWRVSIADQRGE